MTKLTKAINKLFTKIAGEAVSGKDITESIEDLGLKLTGESCSGKDIFCVIDNICAKDITYPTAEAETAPASEG